jgi:zinc transporter ZupT
MKAGRNLPSAFTAPSSPTSTASSTNATASTASTATAGAGRSPTAAAGLALRHVVSVTEPQLQQCFRELSSSRQARLIFLAVLVVAVLGFLLMELSAHEQFEGGGEARGGFWLALMMSFFAGLSTTLGGLVIFFMGQSPSDVAMALVLGLAAGVMIAVCVFDFWLPAARTAYRDGDVSELLTRAVWTGIGCLMFIALSRFLDAHGSSQEEVAKQTALSLASNNNYNTTNAATDIEAGGSSRRSAAPDGDSGGDDDDGDDDDDDDDDGRRGQSIRSSTDSDASPLVDGAHGSSSTSTSNSGIDPAVAAQKWRLALLMMITLTAHNFPEGVAVAFSALESQRLGCVTSACVHSMAHCFLAQQAPAAQWTRVAWCWLVVGGGCYSCDDATRCCCCCYCCCCCCCCCCSRWSCSYWPPGPW